MKILYIHDGRLPSEKANAYQVMKMCEAFSKEHEVTLIYPRRCNNGELESIGNIPAYYGVKNSFLLKSLFCLDLVFLKKMKLVPLWFLLHASTYAFRVLIWGLRHSKEFDVIYSRAPMALSLLGFFKKRLGLPLVYEAHTFPGKAYSYRLKLAREVDGLVVITKKLKKLFLDAAVPENKVLVEPDAVDLELFDSTLSREEARARLKIPGDRKIAAFVGKFHTMGMEKGIPGIIEAAGLLFRDHPDLFFYFVGGPLDSEEKYRGIIERRKLPQERFLFFEKQPVLDVPVWLKAANILLMPHPENTFFSYYVSPLKMFEYMASKRPIVASSLPAIEEILVHRQNALLGRPGGAKDLAGNISLLLEDESLGEIISSKALQDVEHFTWEKRTNRILKWLNY